MFAVILANQLDKRFSLGDRLFSQFQNILPTWVKFTKPYIATYKKRTRWALFYMCIIAGFGFLFLYAAFQSFDPTILVCIALVIGFYLSGWYIMYLDEQTRLKEQQEKEAHEEREKRHKAFERERKKALAHRPDTYDFWSVNPLALVIASWRRPLDIPLVIFLRLTKYFPFSLLGQQMGGHYKYRQVNILRLILEGEARRQGIPAHMTNISAHDEFYLLEFVLTEKMKKHMTDHFLRVVEQKHHLEPESMFMREHELHLNADATFDIILPKDVVARMGIS